MVRNALQQPQQTLEAMLTFCRLPLASYPLEAMAASMAAPPITVPVLTRRPWHVFVSKRRLSSNVSVL
ncbi:MAG: hypothetical protein R2857_00830 [Vampirovibrionales bacterium]